MTSTIGYFGAPQSSDLTWDEGSLKTSFLPAFNAFKEICDGHLSDIDPGEDDVELVETIKWRSIPPTTTSKLRPDFMQPTPAEATQHAFSNPAENVAGVSFLSNEGTEASESDLSVDKDYMKHCLRRDDRVRLRHLTQLDGTRLADSQDLDITSFRHSMIGGDMLSAMTCDTTAFQSFITSAPGPLPALILPPTFQITSLKDLPSAKYLLSIQPSTVTVNLLVTVLSVTLRQVAIKRKPRPNAAHPTTNESSPNRSLVDILVSDTTHQAFKCTFWLPSDSSADKKYTDMHALDPLDLPLSVLPRIRAGSLLLMHKMMLTVYNNAVYAQNLNPREARQRSCVDLVVGWDGEERVGPQEGGAMRRRVTELKDWTERFVGRTGGDARKRKRGAEKEAWRGGEVLPEDSMVA